MHRILHVCKIKYGRVNIRGNVREDVIFRIVSLISGNQFVLGDEVGRIKLAMRDVFSRSDHRSNIYHPSVLITHEFRYFEGDLVSRMETDFSSATNVCSRTQKYIFDHWKDVHIRNNFCFFKFLKILIFFFFGFVWEYSWLIIWSLNFFICIRNFCNF